MYSVGRVLHLNGSTHVTLTNPFHGEHSCSDHFSVTRGVSENSRGEQVQHGDADLFPPPPLTIQGLCAAVYPHSSERWITLPNTSTQFVAVVIVRCVRNSDGVRVRVGVGRTDGDRWFKSHALTVQIYKEVEFEDPRDATTMATNAFQYIALNICAQNPRAKLHTYEPDACALEARKSGYHPRWAPRRAFEQYTVARILCSEHASISNAVDAVSKRPGSAITMLGDKNELSRMWGLQESVEQERAWGTSNTFESNEAASLVAGLERMSEEGQMQAITRLLPDMVQENPRQTDTAKKDFVLKFTGARFIKRKDGVWEVHKNSEPAKDARNLLCAFRFAFSRVKSMNTCSVAHALLHMPLAHERAMGQLSAQTALQELRHYRNCSTAAVAALATPKEHYGLSRWFTGNDTPCALTILARESAVTNPWIPNYPAGLKARSNSKAGRVRGSGVRGDFFVAWGNGRPPRIYAERVLENEPDLLRIRVDGTELSKHLVQPSLRQLETHGQLVRTPDGWYELKNAEGIGDFEVTALAWGTNWKLRVFIQV